MSCILDKLVLKNCLNNLSFKSFSKVRVEIPIKYFHIVLTINIPILAEINNISRNAVHNQIKIVEERLEELEKILLKHYIIHTLNITHKHIFQR